MKSQIIKMALTAAALSSFVGTCFAKAEEKTFERDGYTYVYSVAEVGKVRHISGKYFPGGQTFALDVRNGRVEGTMANGPVSFDLSEVAKSKGELASAN